MTRALDIREGEGEADADGEQETIQYHLYLDFSKIPCMDNSNGSWSANSHVSVPDEWIVTWDSAVLHIVFDSYTTIDLSRIALLQKPKYIYNESLYSNYGIGGYTS